MLFDDLFVFGTIMALIGYWVGYGRGWRARPSPPAEQWLQNQMRPPWWRL